MTRLVDISGQRFGLLTVVGRAPAATTKNAKWSCTCECGNTSDVYSKALRSGATRSCGCVMRSHRVKPDDQITYNSAHYRVKRKYGPPSSHTCRHCPERATAWALKREAAVTHVGDDGKGNAVRYSGNPDDYMPLCGSCHWQYDRG